MISSPVFRLMDMTGIGIFSEDVDGTQNVFSAVVSTFKPLHFDEVCLPLGDVDPSSPKVADEGLEFGIHVLSMQESFYDLSGYIHFPLQFVHFAITFAGIAIEEFQSSPFLKK